MQERVPLTVISLLEVGHLLPSCWSRAIRKTGWEFMVKSFLVATVTWYSLIMFRSHNFCVTWICNFVLSLDLWPTEWVVGPLRLHGGCVATAGRVYSSRAPIVAFDLSRVRVVSGLTSPDLAMFISCFAFTDQRMTDGYFQSNIKLYFKHAVWSEKNSCWS